MRIKERLQILNNIVDAAELFDMELVEYNIENVYAVFESLQTHEYYSAEVTKELILVGKVKCEDAADAIQELHRQLIKDKKLMAQIKKNIDAENFYNTILTIMKRP